MTLLNCCFQSGQQTLIFKLLVFRGLLVIIALKIPVSHFLGFSLDIQGSWHANTLCQSGNQTRTRSFLLTRHGICRCLPHERRPPGAGVHLLTQ